MIFQVVLISKRKANSLEQEEECEYLLWAKYKVDRRQERLGRYTKSYNQGRLLQGMV